MIFLHLMSIRIYFINQSAQNLIKFHIQYNSNYLDTGYLDQLGPSGNFVENSTELISLEITSYQIDISLTSSSKYACQTFSYCNCTTYFYG
jgi:hypothetical protein